MTTIQQALFEYEPELFDNVPAPKRTSTVYCLWCSMPYRVLETPRYLLCDGCANNPLQALQSLQEARSAAVTRVGTAQRRAREERHYAAGNQSELERIERLFSALVLAEGEIVNWANRCEIELRKVQ